MPKTRKLEDLRMEMEEMDMSCDLCEDRVAEVRFKLMSGNEATVGFHYFAIDLCCNCRVPFEKLHRFLANYMED